jgi:hypothetical protein
VDMAHEGSYSKRYKASAGNVLFKGSASTGRADVQIICSPRIKCVVCAHRQLLALTTAWSLQACEQHRKALLVDMGQGKTERFCQQCGRFEDISMFEGSIR